MDTNEFIFKAKEVHGDKYDYSKIEYKKSKDKVCKNIIFFVDLAFKIVFCNFLSTHKVMKVASDASLFSS